MFEGPRNIRKEEFKEVSKLVDTCFYSKYSMLLEWPHVYGNHLEKLDNFFVIKTDNKVVSHVSAVPMTLIADNEKISAIGISGVATYEKYRKHGFASLILNHLTDKMIRDNISLSLLGGERRRYNKFGYENGCRELRFLFSERSLGVMEKVRCTFRKYQKVDLKKIISIHKKERFGQQRSRKDYNILLNRKGTEVWTARTGNTFAYCTVREKGEPGVVTEFGGDANLLLNLFAHFIEKHKAGNLEVFAPYTHPSNYLFCQFAHEWDVTSRFMVKIINLADTLEKFEKQIKRRKDSFYSGYKGSLTLQVKETGDFATLHLGNTIIIDKKKAPDKLILSEIEMVRLLFGVGQPTQTLDFDKKYSFLDAIFPLDFYWWHNESV